MCGTETVLSTKVITCHSNLTDMPCMPQRYQRQRPLIVEILMRWKSCFSAIPPRTSTTLAMTCWWLDVTWLTYLSCLPSLLAYLAACLSRVHWGLLSYDTLMRRKLEHYVPLEIDMRSRNTGQNTWSSCCLNTDSTPYWQRNGILLRCLDLWRTGHKMKQPCS